MVRANKVFGIENAVVVTQSYHLYRALFDAESFGIDAYGVSADVRRYLGQTNRNIREIIARNKDFLFCVRSAFPPKAEAETGMKICLCLSVPC